MIFLPIAIWHFLILELVFSYLSLLGDALVRCKTVPAKEAFSQVHIQLSGWGQCNRKGPYKKGREDVMT